MLLVRCRRRLGWLLEDTVRLIEAWELERLDKLLEDRFTNKAETACELTADRKMGKQVQ